RALADGGVEPGPMFLAERPVEGETHGKLVDTFTFVRVIAGHHALDALEWDAVLFGEPHRRVRLAHGEAHVEAVVCARRGVLSVGCGEIREELVRAYLDAVAISVWPFGGAVDRVHPGRLHGQSTQSDAKRHPGDPTHDGIRGDDADESDHAGRGKR